MNASLSSLFQVVKSLILGLVLFSICRLLFFAFNFSYFSETPVASLLLIFLAGIRYDVSALCMLHAAYIFLALFPFFNRDNKLYQGVLKQLYAIVTAIALLLNCIDFVYFKFTLKRTTADLFLIHDDVQKLLPQYLLDYWYILLLWVFLVFLVYKFYPLRKQYADKSIHKIKKFGIEFGILLFIAPLVLLGIRGGFQVKPLRIINAAAYTEARNIPLVINTPFSVIKSINSDYLSPYTFFKDAELEAIAPFQHAAKFGEMKKQNVVIILLESFSKEYIGYFNKGKGYTPFLDSLMQHSFVIENGYANGKKSIEGIPAVIAGIPSLMDNPYLTSVYGANQLSGLGTLLSKKGYATSFFHGGSNGTMGFDAFSKLAGFYKYYGRTEYAHEADFDGNWGIYDEPFFINYANQLDKYKQPFCSAFFSLSSHHPYAIPEKYKNKFPKGSLEIHGSIGYTDYALRVFFQKAAQMEWFKNTLFVITADHTSLSENAFYQGKVGSYAIPILFYKADASWKGTSKQIAQQIDILPTVLAALNYNESYFAFGNNLLDSSANHFNVNFLNGVYQLIHNKYVLHFDGEKTCGFYDFTADSLLQNNIQSPSNRAQKEEEDLLKAYLQHFNAVLLKNKMTRLSAK